MNVIDFYKRQITVAHIFGIPVRCDYRWFLVFILSVWLIAMNLSRGGMWVGSYKLLPVGVAAAWGLAVVTTVGLFLWMKHDLFDLDSFCATHQRM